MAEAQRNPGGVDICISAITCGCGGTMLQDDDATWTCFNDLCEDRGRRYMPQVRLIEKVEERRTA